MATDQPQAAPPPKNQRRLSHETDAKAAAATFEELLSLDETHLEQWMRSLGEEHCGDLFRHWRFWARPGQLIPSGDWIYWLILAGRGAGKTRAGAEAVREWVKRHDNVNLIGATADDAWDIMVLGESGVLACCTDSERPRFARGSARLTWPNGATSLVFSAEEPDRLRGKQHEKLWCDELAAWRYPEAFEQALLGLRLGKKPQAIVTTTPRPTKLIKDLLADRHSIVTRGATYDNALHLAPAFLERIAARYEGRAIGRQELYGEVIEATPGALWTRETIDQHRIRGEDAPADYAEIIVAVDPPATSGERADECGIIVAAKARRGHIYVLADLSSQGDSPNVWAGRVASAYRRYRANRAVAEVNNGGDMVAEVLRQCDPSLPVRSVRATRGKFLRAEPVAAAYERGLVHHVGVFAKLEDQLCSLTADFDARSAGFSPDRADALVWAVADLIDIEGKRTTGMLDYWRKLSGK